MRLRSSWAEEEMEDLVGMMVDGQLRGRSLYSFRDLSA